MQEYVERGHDRAAADIVLLSCGDRRLTRSSDVAIIEAALDKFCHHLGLVPKEEFARFDKIVKPGPTFVLGNTCGNAPLDKERDVIVDDIKLFVDLHRPETIVLSTHFDCGREGDVRKDRKTLLKRLEAGLNRLQSEFPGQRVYGMMIECDPTKTIGAECLTIDNLRRRLLEAEFDPKVLQPTTT